MSNYPKVSEGIFDTVKSNTEQFLEIVGQYFPEAIKDGEVDFTALKEEMGEFSEVGAEHYSFTWAGKQAAKKEAQADILGRTLRFKPDDSVNADTTENIYIEGDNLEALKLLKKNYYGKIKMIYIDPPYNTGSDFVYRDNFTMSEEELAELSGNTVNGERLQKNNKDSARYHTNWLNMMYPRLKLARELLRDDGVIFVHIDDNEYENITNIGNEIFGEINFINIVTVKTKIGGVSGSSEGKSLKDATEFIIIWAKNKSQLELNPVYIKQKLFDRIKAYEIEGKSWKYTSIMTKLDGKEVVKKDENRNIVYYGYKILETMSITAFAKQHGITEEDVYNKYADRIFQTTNAQSSVRQTVINETSGFDYPMYGCEYVPIKGKNEGSKIEILYKGEQRRMMMFLSDAVTKIDETYYYLDKITTLWDDIQYNNLTKEGETEFSNGKKPIKLLQRIIELTCDKDNIILDFFSGSSSTAHAVMQQNAEDSGNRKFIMVQLPEETADNSEAVKNGYKTICEIGKERIRRAAKKIHEDNPDAVFDDGFKVFEVADTNIRWNKINDQDIFDMDYSKGEKDNIDFMPGVNDIDIVYEIMLKQYGIPLSTPIEKLSDISDRTYIFADAVVVCLDADITDELIEKLAAIEPIPAKYILRDSVFDDDIEFKDVSYRRLSALIANHQTDEEKKSKYNNFTVEFI